MKKLLTLSLFVLCSWYSAMAQFSGSGSGTSSDPYKIYNPDQLSQVRNFLSTPGVCFKLMNNIDLGEWISENYPSQGWQPIGSKSAPFQGVFDGNGKSLINFSINRSSMNYVGFFGSTNGATIKDLTISGTSVKGGQYTGSLVGYSTSTTISNYTYNGNVTSTYYGGGVAGYISGGSVSTLTITSTVTGTNYVGGLFGKAGGQTINNATFNGAVSGTGYLGGAIGQVGNGSLTLTSCTVTAPVNGTGSYVGGIIGQSNNNTTLSSCSQSGQVKGASYLGGVCGSASGSSYTNCDHTGDINAGGSNIGGVLGCNLGTLTITGCNTSGEIKNGTNNVGGVLGYTICTSTVKNCKHVGHMAGTYNMGGTVGFVDGCKITVEGCHSDGNITGTSQGCIGGVCGLLKNASGSSITSSSSWGDITGGTYLGGIVGYIQKTNVASSIDFTTKIKSGHFKREHRIAAYLTRSSSYPNLSVNHYSYYNKKYYYFINTSDHPIKVTKDVEVSKKPANKLFTQADNCEMTSITLLEDVVHNEVTGLYGENRTIQTKDYDSDESVPSSLNSFYAGNGEFYLNVVDNSVMAPTKTNISNCSTVGNITSTNFSDYIGGIVGKDECEVSHYTKKNSSTYYYYDYNSDELSTVTCPFYQHTYEAIFPQSKQAILSTYTITFDITNIEGSYFSGSITGGNYVGGIAGYKVSGNVNRNYSNATITGSDYVGGLVGKLVKNTIETSTTSFGANVALNPKVSATGSNVGRVYGSKDSGFSIADLGTNYENRVLATSNLYKNGVVQSVSDNLQNGTAVGISQLRYKSNYVAWGWDFNDNWTILETESFPYKVWQTAPPTFSGKLATGATSVSGKSVDGGTVTVTTNDAGNTYTTTAPNNTWTVTLSTGLHTGEEVLAYAQKTGLQKSYISSTSAGQIGSGTPDDPYLIYTAYDLAAITKEGNYKVMSDIDLTSWINENSPSTGWEAIGVASVSDSLVIEGDGHKITGLWSKTSSLSDYAGLFSSIAGENSVIRNLTLEDVDIDGGNAYTAGLIGKFDGNIYNCQVTGSVKGKGNESVGLLAGKVDGKVSECSVDGSVTITSGSQATHAGLLAGTVSNVISNCSAEGSIQGVANYEGLISGQAGDKIESCNADGSISGTAEYMGGIVGQTDKNISYCSADVTLTNSGIGSNQYTGGICGKGLNIFNCKVAGIISGPRYAGGLAGYSSGVIRYSLSSGSVSSDRYAGGIAGYGTEVIDCYSTSDVTSTGTNYYAGGLVGLGKSNIKNCYATGNVTSGNIVAGIVGYLDGSAAKANYCVAVNNQVSANSTSGYAMRVIGGYTNGAADPEQTCLAYKDMAVSINNVSQRVYDDPLHGTSTTMEALKTQSTYTGMGWDFTIVWYMNAATGLPDLQWNKEKASQTITINPELSSMTYGGEAVTLPATTDQGMPVTWSSSDTNVAAISGNKIISKGVGSTTISYSQSGNETYSPLEGSFSFRVNKAPLTITADSKSMQEGAAVPELTVTYSGFVNKDTEASLTTPPSVTTTATSASPVGSYPITVSGAVSSNYEITYVNGTLTVVDESADKNKLGGQDISAKSGSQIVLPIELTNEEDITALQLKLILPPHVTIATNAKGRNLIAKTERDEYHTLSCNQQNDGSYIILLYSADVDLIEGNSGSVIDVTLDIDEEIEEGVYPITLSSITLTRKNGSKIYPADATINITISDGLLGDADNDGTVDVADIVVVANYILTNGETPIAFSNADVDGDGIIDVADIVGIANIILSGGNSSVKAREAQDMIDPQ